MQATHPFTAASDKELSLAVGDYIVVRQVRAIFLNESVSLSTFKWHFILHISKLRIYGIPI